MEKIAEGKEARGKFRGAISKLVMVQELGLIAFIIVFGVVITIINPTFISLGNIITILISGVFIFIVGCGMTFVLVGGEIDLSVGSVYAFSGLTSALAMSFGINVPISILIGLICGTFIGFLSGTIVTRFKIPALVVTLGMLYIVRGLTLYITRGETTYGMPESFKVIGQGSVLGIPNLVIAAIIIGIISHTILEYTRFGYNVRSVGGNKQAAIAAGINVRMIRILLFVISGIMAAIGGMLISSRFGLGTPNIGQGFELYVISAVIIGGVSLYGGIGSIFGTFLGALLVSIIQNGMVMMKVSPYWQNVVVGGIMIFAVGIDQYRRGRMWKIR
ncbi:MAG: ABC transporter permease [Actinobacteria bacterium]|nr:ABC transporter permease [Actinomycetota bacterium]MCL6088461.1 ABC transporter permease [Actinomycetota bacterium]